MIKVKEQKPNLVIIDIQLPGKDRFEAFRELRKDPESAGLIIIALTSFAMKGDRERRFASRFDDYLANPINVRKVPQLMKGFGGELNRMSSGDCALCIMV